MNPLSESLSYNDAYIDKFIEDIYEQESDPDHEHRYFISLKAQRKILESIFSNDEIMWLENTGLCAAPATKSHHSNYRTGLFLHGLFVGMELQNLTNKLGLKWDNELSPMRIGLLHDICKCTDYSYIKNQHDNKEALLNLDYMIGWNDNQDYEGHGDKSIIMLAGNVYINEQEKLCIRYHMGAFVDKKEWSAYSIACKKEPNVLYTHTADMIASQIRGI